MPNVQPDEVKKDSSRLMSEVILGKDDDRVDKSPPKGLMKQSRSSVWNLVTAFETGLDKVLPNMIYVYVRRQLSL